MGFLRTLVLILISILALTSLLVVTAFITYPLTEKAHFYNSVIHREKSFIEFTEKAICAYWTDHGVLPATLKNLTGEYVKYDPVDRWNRPYHYEVYDSQTFSLHSLGKDGESGGQGLDFDFSTKTDWSTIKRVNWFSVLFPQSGYKQLAGQNGFRCEDERTSNLRE